MSGTKAGALAGWAASEGRDLLRFDYFGHGVSDGRFEAGTVTRWRADALAIVDTLTDGPVILVGSSMGGAFATDKASRSPCRLLVLICAFSSFPDVAQYHYPFLPARWLVTNRLDSASKIASVEAPVLVTHGRADGVVPFWMGERLHERARGPKRFLALDDHPHADPLTPEFFAAVRELLAQTEAKR